MGKRGRVNHERIVLDDENDRSEMSCGLCRFGFLGCLDLLLFASTRRRFANPFHFPGANDLRMSGLVHFIHQPKVRLGRLCRHAVLC